MTKKRPLIGVITHTKKFGHWRCHYAHKKYILPLNRTDLCAVLVPAHDDRDFYRSMADRFDGFIFTGSRSNVDPELYGGNVDDKYGPFDHERDKMSFTFFEEVLREEKPFLAICRGFQDMNVFMGGTIHQALHEREEGLKHHILEYDHIEQVYANRHDVNVEKGTLLHGIVGKDVINVNSVHRQGIEKLADGLTVNAVASDGVIEAISIDNKSGCALGVQWHPEHDFVSNEDSTEIYKHFAKAAYERME